MSGHSRRLSFFSMKYWAIILLPLSAPGHPFFLEIMVRRRFLGEIKGLNDFTKSQFFLQGDQFINDKTSDTCASKCIQTFYFGKEIKQIELFLEPVICMIFLPEPLTTS